MADRLPLGGERELALASWMAARLLWDLGDGASGERLRARAAATRQWGQALALPAPARSAFTQVLDACARGDRVEALAAWYRLLALGSRAVDAAFRQERRAIEERLAPLPDA